MSEICLLWNHVTVLPLKTTKDLSSSYDLRELSKCPLSRSWVWSYTSIIPARGTLEAAESGFPGHSRLHSNLEITLDYMRSRVNPLHNSAK